MNFKELKMNDLLCSLFNIKEEIVLQSVVCKDDSELGGHRQIYSTCDTISVEC